MNGVCNMDEINSFIKELESVRLKLFRSAANLDEIIRKLKLDTCNEEKPDKKYLDYLFKNYGSYRMDYKKQIGDINELEDEVWHSLVNLVED